MSISTGWSSMKANEALSFVLIGVALVVLRPASSRRLRLGGYALAVAAGAIGLLTIAEYAFSRDLGIDELLFRDDPDSPGTGEPGRMSINSAIAFVLAGSSLLLLDVRRPRFLRPAQLGAIAMSVLATVSVLSYLFSAPVEATGFSAQVMRVGLNTAIAFLLLGAAIFQARPGVGVMALMTSPNAGGTPLRRLLPAAAVIVPTVGWLRLEGEEAGLYNFWVGLDIMVTSAITLLAVAVVVTGRFLERTDVERRRNLSQLQTRSDELEAANKELESFSYSVSHDLRAPLRAIDGFSRILVTEFGSALEPAGQRHLRMVSDNARSMGELIDGLLTFSRLGQQSLSKRRVGVEGLVNDAIADVRPLIGVRDVEITVAQIPRTVEADPTLLKQVFVNLLANAVKYTRQRAVARVEVGSYNGGGQMVFYVRDNGVGFDMRYADRLFRVFQPLH